MNYYVYYKLKPEEVDRICQAVRSMFDAIERQSGVRGKLMRRRDDPATYMEIYERISDEPAFEALLEREAAALGLQRHVERFVDA